MRETVGEALTSGGICSRALAALAALLPDSASSPEAAFLRAHSSAAPTGTLRHRLREDVPRRTSAESPLLELADQFHLHHVEVLAVALAAAVEMDLMCGRAIAHLQAPVGGSRPTLGLMASAFAPYEQEERAIQQILTGAAVGSGLLQLLNEGAPLAERTAAVPLPLCLALNGQDAPWPATALGLDGVPETPLPPSLLAEARRWARSLTVGSLNVVVVRSGSVAEGKAVASEIACALDRRVLFIELEHPPNTTKPAPVLTGLGPLLFLRRLLPVFCVEPGPGERRCISAVPYYSGPTIVLCGRDGSVETRGESPSAWNIGVPSREERSHLWHLAIGGNELAARLASEHRHGSGRIAQLGRLARQQCLLDGRSEPSFADIATASRTGQGSGFETLAQPLPDIIPDEALVAGPQLRDELSRLLLRCRRREGLIEGLGASARARYRPGVRILFTGQSGTGKTLAAGWLATQLGLPLYRADMAAVTSKYIGETEKNLAQLLAQAEESGIILLFDEADSLFGKRTEVKESNDRFANAQTNYLLQRIETFDGIALLTSNTRSRFDPAFCRRLDMIIDFPLPDAEERRLLWLSHLGSHHRLSHKQLNLLAAAADLAGGHIRNAVLTAAVVAQAKNRPIEYADLYIGLADEYRKIARQMPPALVKNI